MYTQGRERASRHSKPELEKIKNNKISIKERNGRIAHGTLQWQTQISESTSQTRKSLSQRHKQRKSAFTVQRNTVNLLRFKRNSQISRLLKRHQQREPLHSQAESPSPTSRDIFLSTMTKTSQRWQNSTECATQRQTANLKASHSLKSKSGSSSSTQR